MCTVVTIDVCEQNSKRVHSTITPYFDSSQDGHMLNIPPSQTWSAIKRTNISHSYSIRKKTTVQKQCSDTWTEEISTRKMIMISTTAIKNIRVACNIGSAVNTTTLTHHTITKVDSWRPYLLYHIVSNRVLPELWQRYQLGLGEHAWHVQQNFHQYWAP